MFDALSRPLLVAHRGGSLHAPENTLQAFDLAVRLGAHVLEMDVRMSRDGVVLVIHDETLDRTTSGHGAVHEQDYATLRELDAGHHFAHGPNQFPFRGRGVGLPRLEEVLEAHAKMGLNIELKQRQPSMVRPVLQLLEKYGATQVLLAARDPEVMRELEAARPGCALGLSLTQTEEVVREAWRGRSLPQYRGRAIQIPPRDKRFLRGWFPLASRRVINAAHLAGIEVHVWTINTRRAAKRLLKRGADAIMTDDPSLLLDLFPAAPSETAARRRAQSGGVA